MATASIKSGTAVILNTILGSGCLAMAWGLKMNGIVFGSFLIIWSALTSSFGLYLQNKVSKYTQQQGAVSYFSLAQLTYPQLSVVFDSAIAIKCFGVGVSYLVVIGDLMPKIMESLGTQSDSILLKRNFWITIFMVLIVIPFSYLKKLDSLKHASIVALFSIVYLICLVVEHYFFETSTIEKPNIVIFGPISIKSTISSFPIFVFAYTCHQNMFGIINELKPNDNDGSQTRQSNIIIRNSIVTACCSYLLIGIIGYLDFGDSVNANIISMYPKDSKLSLIGRLSIVIMVSLSFPLQCHPCRGSINHVIYFILNGVKSGWKLRNTSVTNDGYSPIENITNDNHLPLHNNQNNNLSDDADESFISTTPMEGAQDTDGHDPIIVPLTTKKFYTITTAIIISSYLIAINVTSLAHVLAFVGSTGSTTISFTLPGLFGYLLIKPLNDNTRLNKLELLSKYGGLALCIWGIIVMIVCLSATIFLGATH